jgi:3-phosphoshikimate 1-carboxyvinyltransferase
MLQAMGGSLDQTDEGLHVRSSQVRGGELDLGDTPDALPVMAVIGCLAEGTTRLRNVAHARFKETDRIAVMRQELSAMGADIAEHDDGLTIRSSRLRGTTVDSHHDHRIAMALCMAGLAAQGSTVVKHVEAVQVTFPQFPDLLRQLGAEVRMIEI